VVEGGCGGKEVADLLTTEDVREFRGLFGTWNMEGGLRTSDGHVIKEPQRVDDGITGRPGEMAFLNEIHEVALDLALREGVRPPVVKRGQIGDGAEIVGLCAFGQTANNHIVGHLRAEGAHMRLLAVSDTPSHRRCGVLPTALTHTHSRNVERRKGEMT
jgi:hypothetical protein